MTNVAIEDFDGDGLKDLAASFDEIENSFKFSVYRNDGAGHFSVRTDFAPANSIISSVEPFFISAGDFDSDSRPDIAMVGRWFNSQMGRTLVGVMVFRNIGSAGFPNFTISSYTAEIESANRVFVDDFDSDGKPDILATHKQVFGNETAVIFRNTSSGTGLFSFSQATTLLLRGTPLLGFGDLNLDGKNRHCLRVRKRSDSNSREFTGSAKSPSTNFDAGELGQSFGSTALADFDGDSRTDLVTNDLEDVFFLKNTGSVGTVDLHRQSRSRQCLQRRSPPGISMAIQRSMSLGGIRG
ncbi:MAG: VCBS repeat-containing protein [Acidobacteria bacterium]|nr:VCBS repeat-containing protein [Acidobacteriota bacterium]